jgi:hypothetical protein
VNPTSTISQDKVIARVYTDLNTSGKTLTTGEIVEACPQTQKQFPLTQKHTKHFLKKYTPESPPIKRGETPEVEFNQTQKILKLIPAGFQKIPQPLGFTQYTYRSSLIEAQTIASLSPFTNKSYEDAIETQLLAEEAQRHHKIVQKCFDHIQAFHHLKMCHGDLHLDNIMWDGQVHLIDFASTTLKKEHTAEDWKINTTDDLSEILREAGILQLNQKHTLIGTVFELARKEAHELFPDELAEKLVSLPKPPNNLNLTPKTR